MTLDCLLVCVRQTLVAVAKIMSGMFRLENQQCTPNGPRYPV